MRIFLRGLVAALCSVLLLSTPAAMAQVRAIYQTDAKTPAAQELIQDWKRNALLEQLAQQLNNRLQLPHLLRLALTECGQANAFYRPKERMVIICVELIPSLVASAPRFNPGATREDVAQMAAGALAFIAMHEIGHALIDLLQLPVLGREEDAADSISTYLLLTDPTTRGAADALAGGIFFFGADAQATRGAYDQRHFSDSHSLAPQRAANLACLAYGHHPARFAWALRLAQVSAERLPRCAAEWQQLERSARALLQGAIKSNDTWEWQRVR